MALKHADSAPGIAVDAASSWPGGPGGWARSELMRRIWFTLGALTVYRIGNYVPIPGLSPWVLEGPFWLRHDHLIHVFYPGPLLPQYGSPLNVLNIFSTEATERLSVFALSVMPYIWALIIMQLMTAMSPTLGQLQKAGESGRKQINQFTRYLTVALAAFQAYGLAVWLEAPGGWSSSMIADPGYFFRASTVVTVVGGTMFLMWLGEQITARGIGNGISLIILAGIVANLPAALADTFELNRTGALPTLLAILLLFMIVAVTGLIVFVERARRRIVVQYPKRQAGNRMFGGSSSRISLKLNTAGIIPPIFASSLLLLPLTVVGFAGSGGPEWMQPIIQLLGRGQPLYLILYTSLIVFFCFFYTAIVFNPQDTADNLKKYGGFVAGIRPGRNTADYLDFVLTRLTVIGATYLAAVCILPLIQLANYAALPFTIGGINHLIVVLVTIETIAASHPHIGTTEPA